MSNSRGNRRYERLFFALVCDNLINRRGAERVVQRFQSLAMLAALPWLDQPRVLEPTRLIFEIHDAWDELWTIRLRDLVVGPATRDATRRMSNGAHVKEVPSDGAFGRYLAGPMHDLAVFAALGGKNAVLRVGTHRELIAGPEHLKAWRVIQGGRSRNGDLQSPFERRGQPRSGS